MELRRDALCAAAEMVLEVEAVARETPGLVATVGELAVLPGAPNVIPGRADCPSTCATRTTRPRAGAIARLRERAGEIAAARAVEPGVGSAARPGRRALRPRAHRAHGAGGAGRRLAAATPRQRRRTRRRAVVAAIAPVAMLFVRCAGGVSHHPSESVTEADVALAVDALGRFVDGMASRYSPANQGDR